MESGPSSGAVEAGKETAAGKLGRPHADHPVAAAIHLEKAGGPTRRSGERTTAEVGQTFSTRHSGTGRETSRQQTAMQPIERAGEGTATGERRRPHADHLGAAAIHLEKVGGPTRRP